MTEGLQDRIQLRVTPTMRKTVEQVAVDRGVTWQHVAREAIAVYTDGYACDFNAFCKIDSITGDREAFHAWLTSKDENGKICNLAFWRFLFRLFGTARDEADQRDTQEDALS